MNERLGLSDWTLLVSEAWAWGAPAAVAAVFAVGYRSDPPAAAIFVVGAVLFAWLAWRHVRRVISGGLWQARRGLTRAVRHLRPRTAYLARDEHVFLYRQNERVLWVPFIMLTRVPEDDAQAFSEAGHGIVTGETFKISPVHLRVIAQVDGTSLATTADDDVEIVPEAPRSRRERLRGKVTILRMLRHQFAGPDELRELTEQILVAEPPPAA